MFVRAKRAAAGRPRSTLTFNNKERKIVQSPKEKCTCKDVLMIKVVPDDTKTKSLMTLLIYLLKALLLWLRHPFGTHTRSVHASFKDVLGAATSTAVASYSVLYTLLALRRRLSSSVGNGAHCLQKLRSVRLAEPSAWSCNLSRKYPQKYSRTRNRKICQNETFGPGVGPVFGPYFKFTG